MCRLRGGASSGTDQTSVIQRFQKKIINKTKKQTVGAINYAIQGKKKGGGHKNLYVSKSKPPPLLSSLCSCLLDLNWKIPCISSGRMWVLSKPWQRPNTEGVERDTTPPPAPPNTHRHPSFSFPFLCSVLRSLYEIGRRILHLCFFFLPPVHLSSPSLLRRLFRSLDGLFTYFPVWRWFVKTSKTRWHRIHRQMSAMKYLSGKL